MHSANNKPDLSGRVALITGASRGIGYALALALATCGAHVIAVARTEGGLTELDDAIRAATGEGATLVPVDLKDFAAIDRLGGVIHQRWGKLDILIGNAGILGTLSPASHIKPGVWDDVIAVNLTANWRLIRSLDVLLRASDASRTVFLTSGAASGLKPFWGAYGASKAGLEALVKSYAAELQNTPHRVNLFNPGPTRTAMRAKAMPGEDPATLPKPKEVAQAILPLIAPEQKENGQVFSYL